jgi:hypothetical protein
MKMISILETNISTIQMSLMTFHERVASPASKSTGLGLDIRNSIPGRGGGNFLCYHMYHRSVVGFAHHPTIET